MKQRKQFRLVCKKCGYENLPIKEQSNENWNVISPNCDKCGYILGGIEVKENYGCNDCNPFYVEKGEQMDNLISRYAQQMSENHAIKVEEAFWLVVKQKPKWMPSFLYRAVIKNLVEFQEHR